MVAVVTLQDLDSVQGDRYDPSPDNGCLSHESFRQQHDDHRPNMLGDAGL